MADAVGVQAVGGLPDAVSGFAFASVDGQRQATVESTLERRGQFLRAGGAFIAGQIAAQYRFTQPLAGVASQLHHGGDPVALAAVGDQDEPPAQHPTGFAQRYDHGGLKFGQPAQRIGGPVFVRAAAQFQRPQAISFSPGDNGAGVGLQRRRVTEQRRAAEFAGQFVGGKSQRMARAQGQPGFGGCVENFVQPGVVEFDQRRDRQDRPPGAGADRHRPARRIGPGNPPQFVPRPSPLADRQRVPHGGGDLALGHQIENAADMAMQFRLGQSD